MLKRIIKRVAKYLTLPFIGGILCISTSAQSSSNMIKDVANKPLAYSSNLIDINATQLIARDNLLIDCRPSEYYNGWPENDAQLGGHLPNAESFPSSWLTKLNREKLSILLSERFDLNIPENSAKNIYLYCQKPDAKTLQLELQNVGFTNIHLVTQSVAEYNHQLIAQPNYGKLVSARWLNLVLAGKPVNQPPTKDYNVVEVGWGPLKKAEYFLAHIPKALYLDTNKIESEPLWNRLPDDEIKKI
ncbi:hypothetical protein L0B53_00375 [Vibrio sp. SS-MA-C1-2]|uniref:rhodanese-like domain-containing protein n=1 Tax=Vibrio sp. SS-MA-C1-2 TaxID=2908646 RepID=UPI001F3A5E69|nr:rhodanese-like domain-containing protein [Vibrio sp. SS-MA-C1-2]UJF17267.1 hypothetical protein L0B53_00375 [Vibrio sp. SS-MA-C1-2]